ncbi:hypothetical protein R6Q59_035925 [Mikania micrantha]
MKAQFGTFTKESYKGNPLLCGLPLEIKCMTEYSEGTQNSNEEFGNDGKWFDMDMTSFYGSCISTWFMLMLGFSAVLCVNHYWRRRWFYLIEEIVQATGADDEVKFIAPIAMAEFHKKLKMPKNVGKYDGLTDPKDHSNMFVSAGGVEQWTMPSWSDTRQF